MGTAREVVNDEKGTVGPWLVTALSTDSWTHINIAVAWARLSGLDLVTDAFRDFVSQGGSIHIVVGVDLLGTSKEALQSLLDLQAYGEVMVTVRHNEHPATTFHPKVYCLQHQERALVLLGSSNLTGGGLARNEEANIALDLDLTIPSDKSTHDGLSAAFDFWADETTGLARNLDAAFLADLLDEGYVVPEILIPRSSASAATTSRKSKRTTLFGSAKPSHGPVQGAADKITVESGPSAGSVRGYVQTLQQTDVGVGQTSAGTARRSPEIFVPLAARDSAPSFWGWPTEFTQAKKNIYNRSIIIRVGGQTLDATLMVNTGKGDLRIRSEVVRSAGAIGDVLRVEEVITGLGYDYYVEIVPQGSSTYDAFRSLCTNKVGGSSLKEWGYY